jgi:hypothetical protein
MAQDVDRDARREIEIAAAVFADQVAVIATHRPEGGPRVDGHERGNRHRKHPLFPGLFTGRIEVGKRKRQMAAHQGRHLRALCRRVLSVKCPKG